MTKKQRREYKMANQMRRAEILKRGRTGDKRDRGYWASTIGAIQKGKYS